jgi:hypothetical protein
MTAQVNEISLNGVEYVRKDSVSTPVAPGNRAVIVVDRGWIFAGDVTEENGRIYLDRAVWVFRWESIGFQAVIEDPKNKKIDIRKMPTRVDVPKGSEIFRCPVGDSWGL